MKLWIPKAREGLGVTQRIKADYCKGKTRRQYSSQKQQRKPGLEGIINIFRILKENNCQCRILKPVKPLVKVSMFPTDSNKKNGFKSAKKNNYHVKICIQVNLEENRTI